MSIEHRADFVVPHPVPLARRVLVALGGLAIVVSALLPWIGAPRVGHDTLLGFASAAGRSSAIAWLVPALGVLAILVALTLPGAVRALGVALGLLVLAIACYLFLLPLHGLTQAHVIADVGAGAWIAVTGSALMILGGAVSG
jgi:hypothetical protein